MPTWFSVDRREPIFTWFSRTVQLMQGVSHAEVNRMERIIFFFHLTFCFLRATSLKIWICFSTSCRLKSRYNQPACSFACKNKSDKKNDIFSFRTLFPVFFFVLFFPFFFVCEKTDLRIYRACLFPIGCRIVLKLEI